MPVVNAKLYLMFQYIIVCEQLHKRMSKFYTHTLPIHLIVANILTQPTQTKAHCQQITQ